MEQTSRPQRCRTNATGHRLPREREGRNFLPAGFRSLERNWSDNHYRQASLARSEAINTAIAHSANQEELINSPVVVKGVIRVSGPFTVEGVRPEELSLSDVGLFDGSPNEDDADEERH